MPKLLDKLFFVHIPKTAGTSVEASFGVQSAETISHLNRLEGKAQNTGQRFGARLFLNRIFSRVARSFLPSENESISQNIGILTRDQCFEAIYGTHHLSMTLQHLTIAECFWNGLLSPNDLRELEFFCIVRNPMARLISSWKSHGRYKCYPDINDYIEDRLIQRATCLNHNELSHLRHMSDFIDSSSLPIAPRIHVLYFENLQKDWNRLSVSLQNAGVIESGLPLLPHKGLSRGVQITQSPEIKKSNMDFLLNFYEPDFRKFGYSHDSAGVL